MKNRFPCNIIQRVVNQYLYKVHNTSADASRQDHSEGTTKRFFKLPSIGPFSLLAQRKIKTIAKKYCKYLDIRLAFSSYKLSNMFSVRDSIPSALRCQVVYKFTCAGCYTRYVGETILAPGFVSTCSRIAIPISISIFRVLSRVRI